MAATLEIFDSSIVAIGAFNPAILSPDWLERNNLIGKTDAAAAKQLDSLVITHQFSVIETDWFVLQVLENQFSLMSKGAVTPMLKDLAVGILSLVPQTPITAVGLNFMGHYKFSNVAEYYKIGDVLAPKNIWEQVFSSNDQGTGNGENQAIGLANITIKIQPCKRDETPLTRDEKNITLQPSTKIRGGVIFSLNNHKNVSEQRDENLTAAEYAAQIIDRDWEESNAESIKIFERTISLALAV